MNNSQRNKENNSAVDLKRYFLLTIIILISVFSLKAEIVENFNKNWQFIKNPDTTVYSNYFNINTHDNTWENVNLPHSANIEPLVITGKQWQGNCFYRKNFKISNDYKNKVIAVKFEGAMHTADVFLNGKYIMTHYGGYLPFYIDLTKWIEFDNENCILVRLNNQDNPNVPPGKPIADLDFNYYSGLYRNVNLIIKDKIHISDPVGANRKAAGGIIVTYSSVTKESAYINIGIDVENSGNEDAKVVTSVEIINNEGPNIPLGTSDKILIEKGQFQVFSQQITIENPELWSPNNPNLYTLLVKVLADKKEVDRQQVRIGIRKIYFSAENGFVINGNQLKIRGTNRHQEYPYIGYAISDNANFRDAYKIKQAGFNFVRLSHYPQSESFIDACDELGILVMDAIPGWQFFAEGEFFQNSLNDIRNMVRRDRNHPSIVLWESSLNESPMNNSYMEQANAIVHEELPSDDVYTCGWIDKYFDVFIPARQHARPPFYWNKYEIKKPLLIAEYGDWEYYAQNAGFNQKAYADLSEEERNSRQLRGYGQKRLAQQALNFQEAHNSNVQGPAVGDANWLMFDYNRGYAPDIEASGISDIFRLPKFAFYFYQSQTDPAISNEFNTPMAFIANYWNNPDLKEVKVYSNCDEVELFLNDKSVSRLKHDMDKFSNYLRYSPFTFSLKEFMPGTLTVKGYINGELKTETSIRTPQEARQIKLSIDISGKLPESGCNDVVFVYATIQDENGTVCPLDSTKVNLTINGDAKIIGPASIKAEAGIASFLMQIGKKSGIIKIEASAENLTNDLMEVGVE